MSRFFNSTYRGLVPYTPGEQPRDMKYIKLNTNESPYPPSKTAIKLANEAALDSNLYSDPLCRDLKAALANELSDESVTVTPEMILPTNGSDEILYFAFMGLCERGAAFANITYSFYRVWAKLVGVDYVEIPLKEDFTIDSSDYLGLDRTIFIANPNAPTGIALGLDEIERILASNTDSVVVVDEAYVDFGGESAVKLLASYDNLLVTRTYSKSRNMAGSRLGFGVGSAELIRDLTAIKDSINPYNVGKVTQAAGIGSLADRDYFNDCCSKIAATRDKTRLELLKLGFECTESKTNFLFARHPKLGGEEIYARLRERGILVRHFSAPEIADYNRITVGTPEQMSAVIAALSEITG